MAGRERRSDAATCRPLPPPPGPGGGTRRPGKEPALRGDCQVTLGEGKTPRRLAPGPAQGWRSSHTWGSGGMRQLSLHKVLGGNHQKRRNHCWSIRGGRAVEGRPRQTPARAPAACAQSRQPRSSPAARRALPAPHRPHRTAPRRRACPGEERGPAAPRSGRWKPCCSWPREDQRPGFPSAPALPAAPLPT